MILEDLSTKKSRELVCVECDGCHKQFKRKKHILQGDLSKDTSKQFCSKKCFGVYDKPGRRRYFNCLQCGKGVSKMLCEIPKRKHPDHVFCSHPCSAIYGNAHKTGGGPVSKLEKFLQNELQKKYPSLEFHFNKTAAINGELDIYIPSLSLAFELNGIFHFEPIFGKEKLSQTQNNDNRKFQACIEKGIELCIIDTTHQKKFTEKSSIKYLDIVTTIIENKLSIIDIEKEVP